MKIGLITVAVLASSCIWGEAVAQAGTVTSTYGFAVDWTNYSHPWAARKVASCPDVGKLYVLNYDQSLYYSNDYGNTFTYKDTPSYASDIACVEDESEGQFLVALNRDGDIYAWDIDHYAAPAWSYEGTASEAVRIGGSWGLWALNIDGSIWANPYLGADGFWVYQTTSTAATAVTGESYLSHMSFTLHADGTMWFATSSSYDWHPIPTGATSEGDIGGSAIELSSGFNGNYGYMLYALDDTFHLWHGSIHETACDDGIDNDDNDLTDAKDPACR
jgi:hypothetical protein